MKSADGINLIIGGNLRKTQIILTMQNKFYSVRFQALNLEICNNKPVLNQLNSWDDYHLCISIKYVYLPQQAFLYTAVIQNIRASLYNQLQCAHI